MLTFILVLLGIWFLLWLCSLGKGGICVAIITILLGLHIWLNNHIWWYGTRVEAPEIMLSLESPWDLEPLLGEEITTDTEGNYHVTLVNHYSYFSDNLGSTNLADVRIQIAPSAASLKKTNYHFYLNNKDLGQTQNSTDYQIITDYSIKGEDLQLNDEDTEPTKYTIKITNVAGETEKTLYITRYTLQTACDKYSQEHGPESASKDISSCKKLTEKQTEVNKEPVVTKPSAPTTPNQPNNSGNNPSNNSGSSSSSCLHYEAGRCWDDLEMEFYSYGHYDNDYGYYGRSYYDPENCDQICQDILIDAYEEGYYGY